MRRRDPERIHQARRAARVARLVHYRAMTEDAAEAAVAAWEQLADAVGRHREDAGYWEGLDEWAAGRRRIGAPPIVRGARV